jgi:uncharacterized protein (TIGR02145 family)
MYDAGSMTVWVKAKTEYGCADSVSTVISLMPPPTITLISASDWVAVGHNVAMTEIKYATTNAAGATVTGLPPGVSGSWSMNTYTIGGTPTQIGTFPYTVTTTNAHGCIDASATGIIQVATGCVRSTYTLGTVGFANADTYTQNGITISAPVTATGCQKTSFDAGASGSFTADCREVPGYNAAYYSWCMAMHWNTVLCPSPWRVPSRNDIRTYIDNSAIGSDYLMPSVMGTHDWQPVGYISRASSPNPIAIGTAAWFWLSNSTGPDEAGALIVTSDTHTSPVSKTSGAALRCVQDAP